MSQRPRQITIRYFAWVREKTGLSEETIELPDGVATVGDLVRHLKARGDGFAAAFANAGLIRVALDKAHVKADAALAGASEVAFFPPVTGG